jgi:hypothetical protein
MRFERRRFTYYRSIDQTINYVIEKHYKRETEKRKRGMHF